MVYHMYDQKKQVQNAEAKRNYNQRVHDLDIEKQKKLDKMYQK